MRQALPAEALAKAGGVTYQVKDKSRKIKDERSTCYMNNGLKIHDSFIDNHS
jgi:hypothetical protein